MTQFFDDQMIPINQLRKRFGEIEKRLPYVQRFILTKNGKPFATLTAVTSEKRKLMMKSAGAWKGTELDNDAFWRDVLKRKSRKKDLFAK